MPQAKILIIEDEPITARRICDTLQTQGYEILGPVDTGEQAIQLVAQTRPDLVLIDIRLAGQFDGIQAAREIRSHDNIPIILLAAPADQDALGCAQDAGPLGFILKPFEEPDLLPAINTALSWQRSTAELVQREQFLALLNDVTRAALETPDLHTMLQTLADRMGEMVHADACFITLWDEQTQTTIPSAASGKWRDRYTTIRFQPGELTLTESVLRAGQPLAIQNVLDTPYVSRRLAETFLGQSAIGLPLIADGNKLGAVMLTFDVPHRFVPDEIARCEQAANHIALALARTQNLEAERAARRHSEAIYYVAQAINTFDDLSHQLQTLTTRMAEALPADSVRLITFDLEREQVIYDVQGGLEQFESPDIPFEELMEGLTGWVVHHREPALSTQAMMPDPRESARVHQRRLDGNVGSIIVVPMLDRDRVWGTLTVCNHFLKRDFTHQDVELMQAMASQAVIAIKNADLGANLKSRLSETETLAWLTASLTKSLDLDQVLQSIVQASLQMIPRANSSVIHLIGPDGKKLIPRAASPQNGSLNTKLDMSIGKGIAGLVIAQKHTINVPDALADARFIPTHTFPPERAMLTAPLCVEDDIIGTLSLNSAQVGAFNENDERLLTTLADQAAIAVRNARLHNELEHRVQELNFLNIIGRSLTSSLDPERVFQRVLEDAIDILDSETASIMLLDPKGEELVFTVAAGAVVRPVKDLRMPVAKGIAGQVVREGRPIIVPNTAQSPLFYPVIDQLTGFTTRSILAVPLQVKDRIIGVIEALNKREGFFELADQELLTSMAQSAAIAIENAQLYHNLRRQMNELERTQDQLVQSARLAAVGKLAEGAAHELNNPLAVVVGYTQLLLEDHPAPDPIYSDLISIDEAAQRAQSIVHALLSFASQSEPSNLEPLSIVPVVQIAVELIRHQAEAAHIALDQAYAPDLPPVLGDCEQLRQACLNILTNAVQAMPNGGTLRVSTRTCQESRANQPDLSWVAIDIEDTGVGIEPENLQRIFDPFFTTRDVGKGMGLGLAVAHGVMNRHGGKILVDSTVGQGSTFTILLPVADV